jgi:hypothetical protein
VFGANISSSTLFEAADANAMGITTHLVKLLLFFIITFHSCFAEVFFEETFQGN